MIEAGMKNSEIAEEMRKRYLVSPEKTALAITIANREREILKDIDYETDTAFMWDSFLSEYLSLLFFQLLSSEAVEGQSGALSGCAL